MIFTFKILGTFILQALYTFHYRDRSTADIYRFFDDGILFNRIARSSPTDFFKILFNYYDVSDGFRTKYFEQMNTWIKPFDSGLYNDNILMIKLNGLLTFLSNGSYEVHSVILSTAAMIGIILMIKSLLKRSRQMQWALFLVTMLPSSLLLISGGLKETVLMFGAGSLFYSWMSISQGQARDKSAIIFGLIGLAVCLNIKPYFLASIFPAFIAFMIIRKTKIIDYAFTLVCLSIFLVMYALAYSGGVDILASIIRKQSEFINHSAETNPGSLIQLYPITKDWTSWLPAIPNALFNALARPLPWEITSAPLMLMFAENLLIAWLVVKSLTHRIRFGTDSSNFTFISLCIIPGLILIGLISPVLGATMRYRAPFLLLLLISLTPYLTSPPSDENETT